MNAVSEENNGINEILRQPIYFLKKTAQHPETDKKCFLAMVICCIVGFVIVISATVTQFWYANGNIIMMIEDIEALGIFLQTSGKFFTSAINRQLLAELLDDTKMFWKFEEYSEDFQMNIQKIIKTVLLTQKIFSFSLFTVVALAGISPLFAKTFPIGIWSIQEYDYLYFTVLAVQEIFIPILGIHTFTFDCLFLGFSVNLFIQFKMLNYRFRHFNLSNVNSKEDSVCHLDKFILYIKHHENLLQFSRKMRKLYTPLMLVEYSTLVLIFCAEMFMLSEKQTTATAAFIQHFFIMICALTQLAFYCIPGDYVCEEANNVAFSIYESDWYSHHSPLIKTTIPFLIQRSQKEIHFTAGGLYDINSRALLTVLKLGWSICTVMRASQ